MVAMKRTIPYKSLIIPLFTGLFLLFASTENSFTRPLNRIKTAAFHQQETSENIPYSYKIKKKDIKNINILLSSQNHSDISKPSPKISIPSSSPPSKAIEQDLSVSMLNNEIPDDIFEDTTEEEIESDLSFSGQIRVRASVQAQNNDGIENNTSIRNRVLLKGKYKNKLTLSALSDYLYFGSENQNDDYDIDIYEAKWEHLEKNYELSLGKQIIRWGKADQISPVDTLNPEDLREFIIPIYEERKMPVWMADAKLFAGPFTLEGVVIPFFEKSKLDYFDTNWSVFGHLKKEIQNSQVPSELKNYAQQLDVHETVPDNETEWALRLSTTIKELDIGFTYHRAIEDIPFFKNFPVKNIQTNGSFSGDQLMSTLANAQYTDETIEVEYKLTNIVGIEFETIYGGWGIRGEAVWQDNESFLTDDLTSARYPTLTAIIGADYTVANDTYINLQFAHRHISGYDESILYFDQNTYSLIGEIHSEMISDWFETGLIFTRNLNNNEMYLNPYFKYTYITNFECTAGAIFFSGDSYTWLGRFKDYDHFYFDLSYKF